MKRILVTAAIALSPMLLHAQTAPPAQPASAATIHVSSGVVPPKLIHTFAVYWSGDPTPLGRTAIVQMNVDPTGKPTHLKVVRSLGPLVDQSVLESVSHYRFVPGTLDNQPTTIPLTLEVTVLRPNLQ
ncbi:MAG: energy transducer TonB [Acidobacteriaceae bacterium]